MLNVKLSDHSRYSVRALLALTLCTFIHTAQANPGGATVVHGSAAISGSGNTLTVVNTPGAVINWQQFDIAQNEVTRFVQQSATSNVLNRVVGSNLSQIHGQLLSNGRVTLVNQHGILFGNNAIVDTAGFIASTLDISNQDFLDRHLKFQDLANTAEILNQGFIHTANDGEVLLIAPTVTNEGSIEVEQGSITLAAGRSVTVSSLNYDAIEFEVQAPEDTAVNLGSLMSDGGSIGVFAGSIRNEGTVSANAISVDEAGNISLVAQADNVQMDASVTAVGSNGQGGDIEILGDRVGLFGDTLVDASGRSGGGTVHVGGEFQGKGETPTANTTQVSESTEIRADAIVDGDGGEVIVWSDDTTLFYGSATADAGPRAGDGGFLEISGKISLGFDGFARAIAYNGHHGSVLFDPRDVFISSIDPLPQLPSDLAIGDGTTNDLLDFADLGASSDVEISPLAITDITNTGSNVEVRANRDIVVLEPIITNNPNGAGGDITLRAGLNVLIDANITTDDGLLSITANDPSASSVDRGTGNAAITQNAITTINTGTGNLEVTMGGGVDSTLDGNNTGDDIRLGNINSNHIAIRMKSFTTLSDILQEPATTITAESFFVDHQFARGGNIGSGATPLNLVVNGLGVHIHEATNGGIFISATHNGSGTVTVGDTCYGTGTDPACNTFGPHFIRGIQTDIDSTDSNFTTGGRIDLSFFNSNVFVTDTQGDGNQYGINGNGDIVDIVVTGTGSFGTFVSEAPITLGTDGNQLLVSAEESLSVSDVIRADGFSSLMSLTADSNGDSSGDLLITNGSGGAVSNSAGSISLSGASIFFGGGSAAGESINIFSTDGGVDINATTGNVSFTSGAADFTNVQVNGNNTGGTDVTITAATSVLLIADTGADSDIIISSGDTDQIGISVTAASLVINNDAATADTDLFFNATNGQAEIALNLNGGCTGTCDSLNDPFNTAGSQGGFWASNFVPTAGTLFTWIGGGDGGWGDDTNWDLGTAPGINDDAVIDSDFVSIDDISLAINNLTVTNATLSIGNSFDFTIAGTATFDALSTLEVLTGGTLTTNAGSRLAISGTFDINGGTAVVNGLNNTFNVLNVVGSSASLLGTGSSTATGPTTWTEGVIAHNLTLDGNVSINSATFNARQTGGIVTITDNATANRNVNGLLNITGGGRLVNLGNTQLGESSQIRSDDGTGVLENGDTGRLTNNSTSVTYNLGSGTGLTFITTGTVDGSDGGFNVNTSAPMQWNGGTLTASFGGFSISTDLVIGGDAIKTLDGVTLNLSNPVSISGNGDLDIINGGIFQIVSGGATIHSSDANIVSSDGTGTFQVQGDVFTKNSRSTTISSIFNNNFAVDISDGATLIISDPTVNSDTASNYTLTGSGRLEIATDRDFIGGGFNFTAGTFAVTGNATVNIGTSGGVLSTFNNLEVNISGNPLTDGIFTEDSFTVGGTFDWLSGTVLFTGTNILPVLTIEAGAVLNLSVPNVTFNENIALDGTVNINSGGEFLFNTLGNTNYNGTFNLNSGGLIDVQSGSVTFVNGFNGTGSVKLSGATSVLDLGAASTAGDLQMTIGTLQGNSLTLSALSNVSGGTIFIDSANVLSFNGGVDFSNNIVSGSEIRVSGGSTTGTTTIQDSGSGLSLFSVTGGVFTVNGLTTVDTGVRVSGGELHVALASALDVSGPSSAGLVILNGGTLSGNGTVIGNVDNDGNINPGTSPGTLTIEGDLLLGSNSSLNLDLLDIVEAGIDYDLLDVTGNVVLGGRINMITQSGFTNVAVGDEFSPFKYASASGASTLLVTNSQGYKFDIEFGATGAAMKVLSLPGQDQVVDPIGGEASRHLDDVQNNDFFVKDLGLLFDVAPGEDEEEKQGTLICS